VRKFKDLTKGPIGDVIQFTVKNGRGGLIPKSRKVYIELGQALNKHGGRKTTYRHKKHLTSRNSKKNNKKRKVMVGGALPDGWENMDNNAKMTFINLNENDRLMLRDIDMFEKTKFHVDNILVKELLRDKLDGPPQPPPPPNLFTQELGSRYPQSASASLPRHQADTLPPPSLVYSRTQKIISDGDDYHVVDVDVDDDVDDDDDDVDDDETDDDEINQHPPVKQTRKKSNKRRLICECTK
jgi:hypothetical protein